METDQSSPAGRPEPAPADNRQPAPPSAERRRTPAETWRSCWRWFQSWKPDQASSTQRAGLHMDQASCETLHRPQPDCADLPPEPSNSSKARSSAKRLVTAGVNGVERRCWCSLHKAKFKVRVLGGVTAFARSAYLTRTMQLPGTPCRHLLAVAAQAAKAGDSNGMDSAPKLDTASNNKRTPYRSQIAARSSTGFNLPVVVSCCTAAT